MLGVFTVINILRADRSWEKIRLECGYMNLVGIANRTVVLAQAPNYWRVSRSQ